MDVAVRVGRPLDSSYRARSLGVIQRKLVASPSYLAEHGTPQHPADLQRHECLLHSGVESREVWRFSRNNRALPVEVAGRFTANYSSTLLQLAVDGHGIALLGSWLVDEALQDGRLAELLTAYPAPPAPLQVLLAAPHRTPRAVESFIEFLKEVVVPLCGVLPTKL